MLSIFSISIVFCVFIVIFAEASEQSRASALRATFEEYIATRSDIGAISEEQYETRFANFAESARSNDQIKADFDNYLLKYQITFPNSNEYDRRFKIFERNVDIIDLWNMSPENKEPSAPKLGINQFSHLNEAERFPYRSGMLVKEIDEGHDGIEESRDNLFELNEIDAKHLFKQIFDIDDSNTKLKLWTSTIH